MEVTFLVGSDKETTIDEALLNIKNKLQKISLLPESEIVFVNYSVKVRIDPKTSSDPAQSQ